MGYETFYFEQPSQYPSYLDGLSQETKSIRGTSQGNPLQQWNSVDRAMTNTVLRCLFHMIATKLVCMKALANNMILASNKRGSSETKKCSLP